MDIHRIEIPGRPKSKDNQSRAIGRGGRFFTRPDQAAYQKAAAMIIRSQWMMPMLFGSLRVAYVFYFEDENRLDINNATKSIDDAMQKIVFKNDKQIIQSFKFALIDRQNPRVCIYIEEISEDRNTPENINDPFSIMGFLDAIFTHETAGKDARIMAKSEARMMQESGIDV